VTLVNRLLPLLLSGDHPVLATLRNQWRYSRVGTITVSGAGFFASIEVPPGLPKVLPLQMNGGSAAIRLTHATHEAGCALSVRDGHLSILEGFTYEGDEWSEHDAVMSVTNVVPIEPGN
jgi:hypothetical protein